MAVEVTLTRQTRFLGRNGSFQCKGFYLFSSDYPERCIGIDPITSKDKRGSARLVVPEEDIDAFYEALQKVKGDRG